ncbi:DUF2516 family protein [Micrococcus sp. ACRRV]|uniref:DUF2516 family protein n=1 Tax=Micrococcus sp. ACRRV TaxID=2918203 RepID=UPI001EF2F0D7|nr:DUF2516 family protein [Micrococcus sp. ACRRV]MCG7422967.1 DUF2516 family protein [Micrococcus sp. ACRRV]
MDAPMHLAIVAGNWLFYALAVVAFLLELWAFADAARTSQETFLRAGGRTKGFWLALTGAAAAVGLVGVLLGPTGGFGILGLAAVCVASVYLAGPRDDLRFYGGRRGR